MAAADTARLIASLELQNKLGPGIASANRDIGKLEGRLGRIGDHAKRGISNAAHNLTTIGIVAGGLVVAGLTKSVNAASNLEESLSKVNVVFAENADEVKAWAATSASAFGQSQQAALEAAGTYGNLFQAFGVGIDQSQEMSQSLVELAADLASFNNTSVDDALLALRSGLSGETEPLKRFGIALTDARLRQEALALGLVKTTKEVLPPGIKAQAAYALIMKDSALAQGDFARTSGGLANQQRILRANLDNTAATIGTALLPVMGKLVARFNTFLTTNQGAIAAFAEKLPAVFDKLLAIAEKLPFEQIGASLQLAGKGAMILLDAFSGLPPWVQTAVITGWGLNKLTGGALGGIAKELGSGLIKGVLGMNAGVVNAKAGVVNVVGGAGGLAGAAGAAGKGGVAGAASGFLGAVAKVFLVGAAAGVAAELFGQFQRQGEEVKQQSEALSTQTVQFADKATLTDMKNSLAGIEAYEKQLLSDLSAEGLAFQANIHGVRDAVRHQESVLRDAIRTEENSLRTAITTAEVKTHTGLDKINETTKNQLRALFDNTGVTRTTADYIADQIKRNEAATRGVQGAVNLAKQATIATGARQLAALGTVASVSATVKAAVDSAKSAINGVGSAVRTGTGVLQSKDFAPRISISSPVRITFNGRYFVNELTNTTVFIKPGTQGQQQEFG